MITLVRLVFGPADIQTAPSPDERPRGSRRRDQGSPECRQHDSGGQGFRLSHLAGRGGCSLPVSLLSHETLPFHRLAFTALILCHGCGVRQRPRHHEPPLQ